MSVLFYDVLAHIMTVDSEGIFAPVLGPYVCIALMPCLLSIVAVWSKRLNEYGGILITDCMDCRIHYTTNGLTTRTSVTRTWTFTLLLYVDI